ncbi:MAG: hypothetical protein FWG45_05370 [Oscillospiraceae bacterium]|nr:hypothetical protein [Oscillospiraceae bacterium]
MLQNLEIKNWSILYKCTSSDDIDKTLDSLGLKDANITARREALDHFLGVKKSYCFGSFSEEEWYIISKESLLSEIKKRNNAEK